LEQSGNTSLWLAYTRDHYKIVVELLNSGADINFKTGNFEITDLHRACGWGSVSFTRLLLKLGGDVTSTDIFGKSPFLFAIDFKSSSNCLELIDLLVKCGASVNRQDISGLSALHYASIRGKLDVVEKLLKLNANPFCLNSISYSPLTYSLCYISFMQYIDTETYNHRLKIVQHLINSSIDEKSKLKYCIIGRETMPNLVALFNFIFYGLSQGFDYIEKIGWMFYNEVLLKANKKLVDDQLFTIAQYLIMYNQNIFYFNYFVQRVQITRLKDFLFFYLVNFYNNKKNYLRINLLILYSLMSDNGDALKYLVLNTSDSNINLLESNEEFNEADDVSNILSNILKTRSKRPFSLKSSCRRVFRLHFKHSIYYVVKELDIPLCLKKYLLYDELNDYVHNNDFTIKFMFEIINKL
jgi:ankyrin repeat protein